MFRALAVKSSWRPVLAAKFRDSFIQDYDECAWLAQEVPSEIGRPGTITKP
jgi:hypothetical protein